MQFIIILSHSSDPKHHTEWHPTDRVGPFCRLTRGCFETEDAAHAWASEKHIHESTYEVKELPPID